MYLCTVVSCGMMFFQGFEASFEAFEPEAFSTSNGKCFSVNAAPRRLWDNSWHSRKWQTKIQSSSAKWYTKNRSVKKKQPKYFISLVAICHVSHHRMLQLPLLGCEMILKKLITNLPLLTSHGIDNLVVPLFSEMLKCMRSGFAPWTSWSAICKEPWWTGPATASLKALTQS